MSGSASLCRGGALLPPTKVPKTVKFIKLSAAPSIDGNRSTATSCKFGTTSQSASADSIPFVPSGHLPPDRGNRPPGRSLSVAGWSRGEYSGGFAASVPTGFSFFDFAQSAKLRIDTPRNPVGRTEVSRAPQLHHAKKRHPKWDGVFMVKPRESTVRKQLDRTFSGRSLLFTFPRCGGNRHSSHLGGFMMHDAGKAYCVHGRRFVTPKPGSRPFRGRTGCLIRQPEQL